MIEISIVSIFGEVGWERGLRYRKRFTSACIRILKVRVHVEGDPIDEPALYVSNHRSLLDPFINLHYFPAVVVSKAEVSKYPLLGRGVRKTGVIYVERHRGSSRNAAKEAIRQQLLEGKSVLIYPEGTTSNFETTREFKPGSFKVAADEGIPIVPIAIEYDNPDHRWQDEGLMHFFVRKFSAKHIDTKMSFGPAIRSNNANVLCDESRKWINAELKRFHGDTASHSSTSDEKPVGVKKMEVSE